MRRSVSSAHFAPCPIVPVILAGGIGARLAPISTPERPKPFVPLRDGESLLTKTVRRVTGGPFLPPVLIGRAVDRFALLNHARAAGGTPQAILLEAQSRNTAAAVALAALWAQTHCHDASLAILPADHWIEPDAPWRAQACIAAETALRMDRPVLMGAPPARPDRGFGYMLLGAPQPGMPWREVTQFVEKPMDPQALIAHGARWNMGQFYVTVTRLADAFQAVAPALWQDAAHAWARRRQEWEFLCLPDWPETVPNQPFDRLILEREPSLAIPFDAEWEDLGTTGTWTAMTGLTAEHYRDQPRRVDCPWGYAEELGKTSNCIEKLLYLYPGCRLSLQRHQKRHERWRVMAGVATVTLQNDCHTIDGDQEITIPAGAWHRLANNGSNILIIHEIQIGSCEEHDIERLEDDYGRC